MFHIYDKKLFKLIRNIYDPWAKILNFSNRYYNPKNNVDLFIFAMPECDAPLDFNAQKDFDNILIQKEKLNKNFKNLLKYLRNNYLELDLDKTNKNAFDNYNKFYKDI